MAEELARTARPGRGGEAVAALARATAAYEAGDYAKALVAVVKAKALAPRSAAVRRVAGLVHYKLGRWRDAARELAAYRRLGGQGDLDHVLADAERALGRPDKALELLSQPPPDGLDEEAAVERLVVAAGALCDLGRPQEAAELVAAHADAPVVRPHHLRLWYVLADCLERAGRRREARRWWDAIYAEDPELYDVARRRLAARPTPPQGEAGSR